MNRLLSGRAAVLSFGVTLAAAGMVAAAAAPGAAFWTGLAALCAVAAGALAYMRPVPFCVLWLAVVGSTPEMWLGEMLGDAPGQLENWAAIIAAEKAAGFGLVAVCILRYGARADLLNPALAFAAIGLAGFAHGLHPLLTVADSLRSLLGSVSLYAFSFSRLSRGWARGVIALVRVLPLLVVLFGCVLDAAGIRPLFADDEGGLRLQASSHPAFLGGMALTAIEAGLVELYRNGRRRGIVLMAANLLVLVLSGARAPLGIAICVVGASLLLLASPRFPLARRLPLILAGGAGSAALLAAAARLSDIRLFNLLGGDLTGLSNRDLLWPLFADAWTASPLLGWGIGAGRVILPEDSPLARLLGTTAAHNEYLRIGVEGGDLGLALLIVCFAAWVLRHTRAMRPPEGTILRLVFLGFAIHCYTDNVLIATSSSVFFAWVSAVFARAALERGSRAAIPDPLVP